MGGAGGPSSGASGSYVVPTQTLTGETFYGCDGNTIVGGYNSHGVAFTITTSDLQPIYQFATPSILRGTSQQAGIVGDDGAIFYTMSTLTSADLFASFGTYFLTPGPGHFYNFLVGAGGIIINQITNSLMTSPTTKDLHAIDGILGGDAWAVGADATIIHWGGPQWATSTHLAEPGITLRGVSDAATNDVWAVGDAGHALHWDGSAWTTVATGTTVNLNAVAHGPVQSGFLTAFYAVGDNGVVLKWDGFSWTSIVSPSSQSLYAACLDSNGSLVVGGAGGAYRTRLDSLQWGAITLNLGTPSTTPAIGAVSAQNVWAAFSSGTTSEILHYDGQGWTLVSFLQYRNVARIMVGLTGDVWFYGPVGGEVYRDGTLQSESELFGTGSSVNPAAGDVWVVSDYGSGIVSHLDGTSQSSDGPPGAVVVDIAARASNDVWAITNNQLWHWDGTTWTLRPISMPTGNVGPFQQVKLTATDVWIRTTNLILKWTGTTLTQWSVPPSSAQTRFIPLGDNDIWVSGGQGAFRWNGTAWEQRSTAAILDLSGDATRIWAVTPTTILDFAP